MFFFLYPMGAEESLVGVRRASWEGDHLAEVEVILDLSCLPFISPLLENLSFWSVSEKNFRFS